MWQDVAAFSTVGATVALIIARTVRNRRSPKSDGGCHSCGEKTVRPAAAPTYLLPMESLAVMKGRPAESSEEDERA